ncbi:hypothetical protein HIM_12376 [Hirsutella minnesotensis 3608]|uniref:Enoyl reductase (ER) domain-containing protein n=1 Tax=Hirsutella minnesotensis 3608 TaxID=1043627 RepID=A0A0F7ZQP7_9HYPO|nr:hypothetical protein HIM_12376 [Hirsutella minnesotensis 3608]
MAILEVGGGTGATTSNLIQQIGPAQGIAVLHATSAMARTLVHIEKLLRPGGKLLLLELTVDCAAVSFVMGSLPGWWIGQADGRKGGPLLTVNGWHRALQGSGFTGVDLEMRGGSPVSPNPVSFMVSTKQPKVRSNVTKTEFTIITKRQNCDGHLATNLQQRLSERGVDASIHPLGNPIPHGNFCIALVEEGEPILSQVSDDDFRSVQSIMSHSPGVLWVTRGATVECSSPHGSLMLGLARSVRNEHAGLRLGVLDLDAAGQPPLQESNAIMDVVLTLEAGRGTDYEFALRHGRILVPRIHVSSLTGSMEAVCGGRSNDEDQPLDPNWVEVDVQAAGLTRTDMGVVSVSEMSGVVIKLGDNVRGFARGSRVVAACARDKGNIERRVRLPAATLLKMPASMNFVRPTLFFSFYPH